MVALDLMALTGSAIFDIEQISGHITIKNNNSVLATPSFTRLNHRTKLDKVLIIQ